MSGISIGKNCLQYFHFYENILLNRIGLDLPYPSATCPAQLHPTQQLYCSNIANVIATFLCCMDPVMWLIKRLVLFLY